MAAVPIFVWNGSEWQATGPTIPASPIAYQASAPSSPSTGDIWVDSDGDVTTGSQQFQRFRFVASGGETTISGADADGAILAYTAGLEQVILNGAVLVRGQDYTATDGTNITGLSPALVANDVLEVFSFIAFTVANTYTQSQVDGLIATATAEPGMKLIVPSSAVNGTVSATGAVSFTAASSVSLNDVFSSTYDNYKIIVSNLTASTGVEVYMRLRASGTDNSSSIYYQQQQYNSSTTLSTVRQTSSRWSIGAAEATNANFSTLELFSPQTTTKTKGLVTWVQGTITTPETLFQTMTHDSATQFDGITIISSSGTITGTIRVYGFKN
jgi:hypothetical protein